MAERDEPRGRSCPPLLTRCELEVLCAVCDLIEEQKWAPTYAQLLDRLGWSARSKGTLHRYLERLRQKGVIAGSGRSLRVLR